MRFSAKSFVSSIISSHNNNSKAVLFLLIIYVKLDNFCMLSKRYYTCRVTLLLFRCRVPKFETFLLDLNFGHFLLSQVFSLLMFRNSPLLCHLSAFSKYLLHPIIIRATSVFFLVTEWSFQPNHTFSSSFTHSVRRPHAWPSYLSTFILHHFGLQFLAAPFRPPLP